jgi:hypothetical protein
MSKPAVLALTLLALASSAAVVLAVSAQPPAAPAGAAEFHRLTGGMGFGPALDLDRCAFSFDPRLCPACSHDCGPIPGGRFFCPHHAGAILDYPPLEPRRE